MAHSDRWVGTNRKQSIALTLPAQRNDITKETNLQPELGAAPMAPLRIPPAEVVWLTFAKPSDQDLPDSIVGSHPNPLRNWSVLLDLLRQRALSTEGLVGRLWSKQLT